MSNKNRRSNGRARHFRRLTIKTLCVILPGLIFGTPTVLADGTEILGPPSVPIADGSRFIGTGIGLSPLQSGTIEVGIPAGATVEQVLLYWDGENRNYTDAAPDLGSTPNTIQVNGIDVTGNFIGGRSHMRSSGLVQFLTFRADITELDLVGPGSNMLDIGQPDFGMDGIAAGAGVLVVIDDGTSSTLEVLDGNDYAYLTCREQDGLCNVTVRQTFSFPAADSPRDGELVMFFSSVAGDVSGSGFRSSVIDIVVGGGAPITLTNALNSLDGEEWDTVNVEFEVPPGVTQVEVEAFSGDFDLTDYKPASLKWLTAALSVPDEEERGGGQGCTPGYWKQNHHLADWTSPYDPDDPFSDHFEDAFPGLSLLDVVGQGGGGLAALGRHTVAALLSAANPDVSYDLTPQEVIDAFNDVYDGTGDEIESLKDRLAALNEQGCPLNNSDGSNNNGNPAGNGAGTNFTTELTIGATSVARQNSGGGSAGGWEILALLAFGLLSRARMRRPR